MNIVRELPHDPCQEVRKGQRAGLKVGMLFEVNHSIGPGSGTAGSVSTCYPPRVLEAMQHNNPFPPKLVQKKKNPSPQKTQVSL
jgi:hypothetical protein